MPGKKIPNLIAYWKRKRNTKWDKINAKQKDGKMAINKNNCDHYVVSRVASSNSNGSMWSCDACGVEFYNLQNAWDMQGKLKLVEPTPSLRDQFAMSVLNGWISCDSSGVSFWPSKDNAKDAAVNAYMWADVMMEALKV